MFLPIHASEIHLLEPEALDQLHAGLVSLHRLHLDDAEVLLLQVTKNLGEKKLAEALASEIFADLQGSDAGGGHAPAPAEALHLPRLRASDHAVGNRLFESKLKRLKHA